MASDASTGHLRQTISAFIVCSNEERKIRRCLESVRWCDEIVVVLDDKSSDGTAGICREYTSKILVRGWTGYVDQKRFGLESCTSDWALNLDADEEVSPELREEIEAALRDSRGKDGFELNRVVFFLGRWWRKGGWYPEFRLRLLRRTAAAWGGEDPHEHAVLNGTSGRMTGELRHYTYDDIADQIRRLNSHSTASAKHMAKRGKHASLRHLVVNPIGRFIKFYLLKRGYREGLAGFIVAVIEAWYVHLKYAKLWELQRGAGASRS